MREDWIETLLPNVCDILDNLRKPINATERNKRIEGKKQSELYPYYGATGQVGYIDDYLTDGDFVLIGEDAAPFLDYTKDVAFKISGKTWVNSHAHILKSYFNDDFLRHYLNQFQFKDYVSGTTRLKLTQGAMKRMPVRVAPLPIQRSIVSKIESLFSDLDNGIANLKKAQEQLKIYRQAVLKKAFEGELTKKWREKQTNLPTAEELLEQIKKERQNHYNKQLEGWKKAVKEWEENGMEGRKPLKPQLYKKFASLSETDISNLPILPKNWKWEKFGNVCVKIMDGTHFSPKNIGTGAYKYITAKNIKEGRIDLTKISYVTKDVHEEIYSRCDVKKGDILYIKDGATTGKAAINNLDEEFSLLSSVAVFRTSNNLILSKFLEYFLNAQITRNRMLSFIAGVAITRLTLVKLNNSVFIICPIEEQHQIVREIESRLSVCDKVEESIIESLEKAKALRQSILKKAFEGKLLSKEEIEKCKQEKEYEPAAVLLERIKNEKVRNKNK